MIKNFRIQNREIRKTYVIECSSLENIEKLTNTVIKDHGCQPFSEIRSFELNGDTRFYRELVKYVE